MNSNNPFFKNKSFTNTTRYSAESTDEHNFISIDYGSTMTVQGTINKSLMMLLLLVAGAAVTWSMTFTGYNPMILTIGGAIIGLILVLIAAFKPQYSGYLAPGYAVFECLL